jgi:Putative Flp pilus-assembly TadE/G-like
MTRSRPGIHSRDRGSIAMIVGILLGGGVLLGAAALTVDIGVIGVERGQLQNGADAAAIALAQQCAKSSAGCTPDSSTTASLTALAGQNASDGLTDLDATTPMCASSRVTTMPTCIEPTLPGITDCPGVPSLPAAAQWVEVRTQTRTSDASKPSILPPFFAQSIPGSHYAGQTVHACARAAWGPGSIPSAVVPIAVSLCEWEANTGGTAGGSGTYYPGPTGAAPGYGGSGQPAWPSTAQERLVSLQSTSAASSCPSFNGHQAPGGFSWVKDPSTGSSGCNVRVGNNTWLQTDTGNNTECNLDSNWKRTLYLPVFDCMTDSSSAPSDPPTATTNCQTGNGTNLWYHVVGFATFYLSGFHLSGDQQKSPITLGYPCSGGDRCLSGWFTKTLIQADHLSDGTTQELGLTAVVPAG